MGRLSWRLSRPRDSWERATTGTSSSRARILRPRLISDTSTWRFSALCPAGHQLEVVDDHQPEVPLGLLQPAGPGPDVHHREVRVVVDEDGRLAQPADGVADLRPVRLAELARSAAAGRPPWPRRPASRWVSSRWLISSENSRAGPAELDAGVGHHAEGEAGLAHGRAGPHDGEVRRLQPGQDLVEVEVAGGQAGDGCRPRCESCSMRSRLGPSRSPQRGDRVGGPALGDVEDHAARPRRPPRSRPRARCSRARRSPRPPRPAGGAGRAPRRSWRSARRWRSTGCWPAGRRAAAGSPMASSSPGAPQLVGHRDRVDRLPRVEEGGDGAEDVPVGRLVEVVGRADLDGGRDGVGREQHGAEQRLLGLEIVGGHPGPAGGGPEGTGTAVVEGLDHGLPTLTEGACGR